MLETTWNNAVYKIGHTRHSPLLLITYEADKGVLPYPKRDTCLQQLVLCEYRDYQLQTRIEVQLFSQLIATLTTRSLGQDFAENEDFICTQLCSKQSELGHFRREQDKRFWCLRASKSHSKQLSAWSKSYLAFSGNRLNLNRWMRTILAKLLAQSEVGQSFAAGSLQVLELSTSNKD